MTTPRLTLIICTHEPRADYLGATLRALREQTLPVEEWELLVVDNCSQPPVSERFDLTWHPRGRHLREEKIGLTNARLCGLRAASAELIVFSDDDNVLEPDYLATALKIADEWPMLGIWGCHITGQFEGEVPAWLKKYAHHLAVRKCVVPIWASYVDDRNVPCGAGMVLREVVGRAYIAKSEVDSLVTKLDRIGKGMGAAGDHDICHTAHDLGLGIGRFPQLRMTHLIPAARMEEGYFIRLAHGNARSALLLALSRHSAATYRTSLFWPMVKYVKSFMHGFGMEGRILRAQARGEIDALLEMRHAFNHAA